MRHARSDYDRIQDPSGLIPQDEPVFLLRAQDPLAAQCVALWADLAQRAGVDPKMVRMAWRHVVDMGEWPAKKVKPDLPAWKWQSLAEVIMAEPTQPKLKLPHKGVVAFAPPPYTPTPYAQVLAVRSGPGTNYPIVARLPKGSIVAITQIQGTWGQLKKGGWASLEYIKPR
jgi:hypothetical protein